jgi:AcrR family transcriptional regulator
VSEARRSGGRPTAQAALLLEAAILDDATAAFLRDGYAATTIEAIARACSVAKRTIYARWNGKPALFRAVLERLMAKWLATAGDWPDGDGLEPALRRAAGQILAVALTPEAVALHRLVIAECGRFPEVPVMLRQAGASLGTARLTVLLDRAVARGEIPAQDTMFAAEQFMDMLLAGPQRRALGLGVRLDADQARVWLDRTVLLFLGGVNSLRLLPPTEK